MSNAMEEVEILLVEDNPTDAELAIRALKKSNLANKLVWSRTARKRWISSLPPAPIANARWRRGRR